jgi:hypothetical protein
MTELVKPVFLAAYAGFGIHLSLAAARVRIPVPALLRGVIVTIFFVCTGVTLLRFFQGGYTFGLCVLCATVLIALKERELRSTKALIAVIAVVTASASLAWWLDLSRHQHSWWRPVVFALVFWAVCDGLSRRERQSGGRCLKSTLTFGTIFAAAGLLLLTDRTPYTPGREALAFLAHHHGAYIGSALHVLAGLVPFYDVPLQYGLGPTMAIAATCRLSNCLAGVDFLAAGSTLLMGLAILGMALQGSGSRWSAWRIAAVATVFAAVFLWPGFPEMGTIPTAVPSAGGMRFLPVTLVAFFLFFERPRVAMAVFVPAVLWSPESAFMTIAVFGVYETVCQGFAKAALKTFGLAIGSYAAMVLIHRLIYGVWVQPDVMFEYVLHVPGPLPIDPFTSVLLLSATFALAAWLLHRQQRDTAAFRRDVVAGALLFAAASYYLGRSHPNNICNLMPFMTLVALRGIRASAAPPVNGTVAAFTAAGLATATAAIVFSAWTYVPFGRFFLPAAGPIAAAAETLDPKMNEIRRRIANPQHLGIADFGPSLTRHPDETVVWTPMDPASLWAYVPAERRKLYIRRAAQRLRRSGWIVVEGDGAEILDEFKTAYVLADQTTYEYGSAEAPERFTVARLVPSVPAEITSGSPSRSPLRLPAQGADLAVVGVGFRVTPVPQAAAKSLRGPPRSR